MSAVLLVENTSVITIAHTPGQAPWHVDVENISVTEYDTLKSNFPVWNFSTRDQALAFADEVHERIHGETHDNFHEVTTAHQETEYDVDEENTHHFPPHYFNTDTVESFLKEKGELSQRSMPYSATVRQFRPFLGGIPPERMSRHRKKTKA